ncbi:MAG: response regulator, partial [Gammaproteobacteria bacterium]|nr:response regulator [Gammaproteobacteria bacterium]
MRATGSASGRVRKRTVLQPAVGQGYRGPHTNHRRRNGGCGVLPAGGRCRALPEIPRGAGGPRHLQKAGPPGQRDSRSRMMTPMSRRPRILVIDDMAENIQVLGEYLSDAYEIHYALSGPEALALIEDAVPDLILLDVMMPGMDGYAVCDALKRHACMREVPILFVTARNDAESESRAFSAGAVDFIQKPVNREVVRARVGLHLSLRARERELSELNAELGTRVAERTQELADALAREQVANRAKSLFLANVNHELRTPMNAILGLSGLLANHVADPQLRERVAKIDRAGQQLLRIVDDVIDMADLQAGKIAIECVAFDVSAVLDRVAERWRARAETRGLELVQSSDPGLPSLLYGDPARLGQILGNLLGNAVKFSAQGSIGLRARPAGKHGKRL